MWAYRYQYGMAGCCGRQDQLELGWASSLSSLGQGWLELSTVGCGQRRERLLLPSLSSSTLRMVVLATTVVDAEMTLRPNNKRTVEESLVLKCTMSAEGGEEGRTQQD